MKEATFDDIVEDWVNRHDSPNTRAAYRSDLDRFRTWWEQHRRRPPLNATPADVDRYSQACVDAGSSAATVARRVSALSSFFTYAADRGVVGRSPVRGSRAPPTTTTPTADLAESEIVELIRASRRRGHRTTLLVGLLLFDGLKLAEALAVDAADVAIMRPRGARITLRRSGEEPEHRRLDRRTATAAIGYLDGRTDGPLLLGESPTRGPSRLTRFGADHMLKVISADAGLAHAISANTLRRSYVATAFASGTSLEAIRDRLGHNDVRTTRRHLTGPGELRGG